MWVTGRREIAQPPVATARGFQVGCCRTTTTHARHPDGDPSPPPAEQCAVCPLTGVASPCASAAPVAHSTLPLCPYAGGPQSNDLDEVMRCCLVLVDVDIPLVALSDGVHARSFAGES